VNAGIAPAGRHRRAERLGRDCAHTRAGAPIDAAMFDPPARHGRGERRTPV